MPRDKTLSHIKVNKAIKEEFLEKGFEAASIRGIGARAGMTSAGLYRHYEDNFSFSRGSSQPRDQTQVSRIAGGFSTSRATREACTGIKKYL